MAAAATDEEDSATRRDERREDAENNARGKAKAGEGGREERRSLKRVAERGEWWRAVA